MNKPIDVRLAQPAEALAHDRGVRVSINWPHESAQLRPQSGKLTARALSIYKITCRAGRPPEWLYSDAYAVQHADRYA